MRLSTPLKSSLKSSNSKRLPDLPDRRDNLSDKDTSPKSNSATPPPPPRSPSRVASGISPIKKHFENLEAQPRQQVPSPTYPSEKRQPDYGQPRPRATPTPTRTHRPEYDQVRLRDTPASVEVSITGYDYSRQRVDPSRIETCSLDYDQLRPKSSPTLSETPRTEHGESRYQETPTRKETHKLGYDQPRPLTISTSVETPKPRTEYGTEYTGNERSHRHMSVSSSINGPRSTALRALTQVDGSPERHTHQPSCDLDPMIAFQAGPGLTILKAPSTMRSQPKMSHVNPKIAAATLRSSVWRKSSHGSVDSGMLSEDEPVKKASPGSEPEKAALDQMDGAMDFIISVPSSRGSFIDLRGEFEKRGVRDSQTSAFPVLKSRPHLRAVLTKKQGHDRESSRSTSRKASPKSALNGHGDVKSGANKNKVMGLAAIFDTAAKASPFVPTPGGAIQKKRRGTAGVISPYTSNPSPRASLQSVASVSTPVSLMSPTRLSIHISTPAKSSGKKKSMIPRLQDPSATYSTGKTEIYMSPLSVLRRDESRFSAKSSDNPSRLFTPSRLPVKKVCTNESPPLPQFDGLSNTKQPLLKLTAQQEIRPVGFHSSPIPRINGGYKIMSRLSQQSSSSKYSEDIVLSGESNALSLTPSRGRSALSLRDQIRSLRTDLSAKNEDCAQLQMNLEESRKMKEVNEILFREDLDRAKSDTQKWRRRAESAEKKVDKFERLAMQIKNARDHEPAHNGYRREQQGDTADDYSFISESDNLSTSDRPVSQPLTARMNQSVRRTPPVGANGVNSIDTGDGFSECSSSTVVRTIVAPDENGPLSKSGLWSAVNELVDFASPGLLEERL